MKKAGLFVIILLAFFIAFIWLAYCDLQEEYQYVD